MKPQHSDKPQAINQALIALEAALRNSSLWQVKTPTIEALQSTQPFCLDTLDFSQWLQFLFLPRMHALLEQQEVLPRECDIASMAEESLKHQAPQLNQTELAHIIECLNTIDKILSNFD
jgi:uncharacterized protein YqcC (DUF446 family)